MFGMFANRISKILTTTAAMHFSKIKVNPISNKLAPGGLKGAPNVLKKPPPMPPKVSNEAAPNLKKINAKADQKQSPQNQVQAPILKKKHAVVTIMGHVDHGKTTLIDFLRNSDIAKKEDGGITQRIGAFRITCLGQRITFIDTPGHEAFVNMRERGASVTDLVILVVSATEGVKKQTLEVIQIIKKLNLPVIVAINKIDIPEANPQEAEAELEKAGLKLQINGGDIPVVHISAKQGTNVNLLCQLIIDQTKNSKAVFNGMVEASVLQAYQNKEGLNSMTVIIEKGVLKPQAILILRQQSFRVKSIIGDRGQQLKQAFPGEAVQIVGIPFIPSPGDQVFQIENDKMAKYLIEKKISQQFLMNRQKSQDLLQNAPKIKFVRDKQGRREKRAFNKGIREVWMNKFAEQQQKLQTQIQELKKKAGNDIIDLAILELQQKLQNHRKYVENYLRNSGDNPEILNFTIKFADRGMEETILMQLEKLKPEIEKQTKVKLNMIKSDVGDVTVNDIQQAQNFKAKIFTFGSNVSPQVKSHLGDIEAPHTHKLIHTLLKDIKQTCIKKKNSTAKGSEKGRCSVAQIFTIKQKKKQIQVPGVKVTSGKISKKAKVYILRNGVISSQGLSITFMKAFKKDVLELKKGEEGTVGFLQQQTDIQKGDELAFYQ